MTNLSNSKIKQLQEEKDKSQKHLMLLLQEEHDSNEKLNNIELEFNLLQTNKFLTFFKPNKLKKFVRTIGAYIIGRRNIKNLYHRAYKEKKAENDLKKYRYALYEQGFTKKATNDLHELFLETSNKIFKRAIAWELLLFYANEDTKEGARMALHYVQSALKGEKSTDLLRRKIIVVAECYVKVDQHFLAKKIVQKMIDSNPHLDLFLSMANTEFEKRDRIQWINKGLRSIEIDTISTKETSNLMTYDYLQTNTTQLLKNTEPKISVILPAYNSETGIKVAIESILNQTWQNIELIIVDDCSTDQTTLVIQQYMKKDSRVQMYSTGENSGPYVARNIGLQHATGEFVTINDADDWSHTWKLETQVNHLINNSTVVANTSEQARMREDFTFYRRGMRGRYIFSNMSSLMFRRKIVMKKVGYWDCVRFAADGEFKRRLIEIFGKNSVIDLQTGPLSFQRQSDFSLTASSSFGYHGFFMGARKEYAESFTTFHQRTNSLFYNFNPKKRLFPVPYQMLPQRKRGKRHIDIVMVADFYKMKEFSAQILIKELKQNQALGLTTGLVQMHSYHLQYKNNFHNKIREMINGTDIQMLVYGEEIDSYLVIVRNLACLQEWQKYVPKISCTNTLNLIDEMEETRYNKIYKLNIRQSVQNNIRYFNRRGEWFPIDQNINQKLLEEYDTKYIRLAKQNWLDKQVSHEKNYLSIIKKWIVTLP